jgi:protein-L-isoaspartate(D-aspartate) O-methyltransferase
MADFARLRRNMVDSQIRTNDVTDRRIIQAMLEIERERFVPEAMRSLAYMDEAVRVTAPGVPPRYLASPMALAKLLALAAIEPTDSVLDIGCATGYSTAVIARLARTVIGLESDPALARQATANLAGTANAKIIEGPLVAGLPAQAPYQVIVIAGSVEVVPESLRRQLAEGGRLVTIVGQGAIGRAMLYERSGDTWSGRPAFDLGAPLLTEFARAPAFAL